MLQRGGSVHPRLNLDKQRPDLARDHPQVVCSLHCGVVEGVTGQAATIDANPGVRCVVPTCVTDALDRD